VTRLILRRIVLAIVLAFVVSILTFLLVAVTPGNPAYELLGSNATPAAVHALDVKLHLNEPVLVQYWHWLYQLFHGNLGTSLFSLAPVSQQVNSGLIVTLTLIIGSTLFAAVFGIGLGIASAFYGRRLKMLTDVLAMLGFSIPNFLLATYLVFFFAVKLHWLPATGFIAFSASPLGWFRSLILPVIALGLAGMTAVAKQTRDSMGDVLSRDFIGALRADGIPERSVIFRHALRNASIPIITVLGLIFVASLGGAALVETVFVLPGLGSLIVRAVVQHDLTVIEGVALYFTLIVIAANFVIDLLYGWLDPRTRTIHDYR
jgi:peptide/nickel transport system permease protein